MKISRGDMLKAAFWPEPVRVLDMVKRGSSIEIHCVEIGSQRYHSTVLSQEDLEEVEVLGKGLYTFSGSPDRFKLAIEALRIKLAYEYDPYFAVSVSKIDPVPHQLEAVYDYILPKPKIRFLLADDPGAGKTIMAGLLLKELKYRGAVERTLIVTPPSLTSQWIREMKNRFGEAFVEMNRSMMKSLRGRNPWRAWNQIITSMDFARQEDVRETLRDTDWDLIIADEAHKMAAYRYGDDIEKTKRYQLGEALYDKTFHLLFLTATPHKGDPENFRLLLRLLDQDLFASTKILTEAVRRRENPLFLRRMKEDMVRFDGKKLFPERKVNTALYKLDHELELYNAVTEYVSELFDRALKQNNRGVGFAMMVLQRRLASSIRAIKESLKRRRDKLMKIYKTKLWPTITPPSDRELEDMREQDLWRKEKEAEGAVLVSTREALKKEMDHVKWLIDLAEKTEKRGEETKLRELHQVMQSEQLRETGEKLLIFTEHKDTLRYLVENLEDWGYSVTEIHGDMTQSQRESAEEDFNDVEGKQIMVATEAAGEGINLHWNCHLMVNYDIPWNPNRLEQRMGRIHRYGQKYPVVVYNLVAENTREGQVLAKLFEKLEIMKKQLGSDKVYDVVGQLFEGIRLDRLLQEAVAGLRSAEDLAETIGGLTEIDEETFKRLAMSSLATRYIDLGQLKRRIEEGKARRLVPEYIERFFRQAFKGFGGTLERRKDGLLRIPHVPTDIRRARPRTFGEVYRRYPKITFRKEEATGVPDAELVGPGHPLFDAVLEKTLEPYAAALEEGATFADPEGNLDGLIWFIRSKVKNGLGKTVGEKLFTVFQKDEDGFREVPSSILLELASNSSTSSAEIVYSEDDVKSWILENLLKRYKDEVAKGVNRELEIRRRYLEKSFEMRIHDESRNLKRLEIQAMMGRDMDLAIRMAKERFEKLIQRKETTLMEIEHGKHLTLAAPEIVAVCKVLPKVVEDPAIRSSIKRDDEVEAIAMRVAMEYERKQGRTPKDVSKEIGRHYDIESSGDGEIRYIEVKGRAGKEVAVALTENEWRRAKELGEDSWLYIVTNAKNEPKLHRVKDPSKMKAKLHYEAIRYIIPQEEWKRHEERETEYN